MSEVAEIRREIRTWEANKRTDVRHAHTVIRLLNLATTKRDRAMLLGTLHTAVRCVRIDIEQINREWSRLSLCSAHSLVSDCERSGGCAPTF